MAYEATTALITSCLTQSVLMPALDTLTHISLCLSGCQGGQADSKDYRDGDNI